MAKKDDDDFEGQLDRLDGAFSEDDDQEEALGGFPGDAGGFPGADEPEPEFDAEDLFAEDFGGEEPEVEAVEEVDYEPDAPEEDDEPDFEEEDEPESEPEEDFGDDDAGEDATDEVAEDEDDPFANLDDEDTGAAAKKKSNMVFLGAVSVMALLIGGVGYAFVMPILSGGGSAPAPVSQYAAFYGNNAPAAIPTPPEYQAEQQRPPALPQPQAGGNRVQVPGYAPNVDQNQIMPDLGGSAVALPNAQVVMPEAPMAKPSVPGIPSMPGLPAGGQPALPGLDAVEAPQGLPDPMTAMGEAPLEPSIGLEGIEGVDFDDPFATSDTSSDSGTTTDVQPLPGADAADPVMAKLEDLLSRFTDLEKKIVTEDDVIAMVDAAVAKVEISGGDEAFKAVQGSIDTLGDNVAELQSRVQTEDAANERIAQLEAKFEEKIANMAEVIASYEEVLKALKEKDQKVEKVADTKTKKLQQTVSRQQAEIVSLKSRGGAYVPPAKPEVHTNYRLAGLSNDQAWIETPGGVSRFSVGQSIPGLGLIKEFRAMDGHFAVITTNGIIVP